MVAQYAQDRTPLLPYFYVGEVFCMGLGYWDMALCIPFGLLILCPSLVLSYSSRIVWRFDM